MTQMKIIKILKIKTKILKWNENTKNGNLKTETESAES